MKEQRMHEAEKLLSVPSESSEAFKNSLIMLVEQVNRVMMSSEDIAELAGGNPPGMMFDHRPGT